ncbi:ABC transporter permease [Symbioplanes lichenis]|uniref:ABC transporter permease n=1 Tax=Symbioplanes lichenis TaxID=1629072 RepID=UPI002738548D|nr:ABC transporter permease [Actinoplanes lichenis]
MTTFEAAKLVAAREVRVKLRDKTFLFSTAFFLIVTIGSFVIPSLLNGGPTKVAVSLPAAVAPLQSADFEVTAVPDDAAAEKLVRDGDVAAAVVSGPRVLAMDDAPSDVVGALSVAPPVQLLDPEAIDPALDYLVPFALAFLFFITSFTFGMQIAQSVTEEKQTRIVEILVSSVPVRALLAGKVAAMTLLAFGQIALIAIVAIVGVRVGDMDTEVVGRLGPTIAWFLPFFILGFVMLATLWAGVGALAARQEDLAGTSTPLQMIVMLPMFAVVFLSDNDAVIRILSYVPLSSPMAMPIRLFRGDAAVWEPIVALVILAATAAVFLALGSRIYEGSLLRTNGRTSFKTALARS